MDEGLEEFLYQQHGVDLIADDQASRVFITELLIKGESEVGKESLASLQILHGQVDEYFVDHDPLLLSDGLVRSNNITYWTIFV
jgi:hypothetical protein